MKLNDDTFHFELTLDELNWLAGAFGISSLPLPDHIQPETSPTQLIEGQKRGHASLLRRGLIQPSPGFGWQVDRLPAAFVQWMATATSMLKLERIEKKGTNKVMHIFTSDDQALFVKMTGSDVNFVLYKTRAMLKKSLNLSFQNPSKLSKSSGVFTIPQPQAFILVAWNDPLLAGKILANSGLSIGSEELFKWTAALNWLGVLSKLNITGKLDGTSTPFCMCVSDENQWGGMLENEIVKFSPIAIKDVDAIIEKMI